MSPSELTSALAAALAARRKVSFGGPGTITGRLDFQAAKSGQFSNNNSSNVGPSSVNYTVPAVTTAISTITNLSSSLAEQGPTRWGP